MGGPLSPILVDIVMEDLLDVAITKFNESPKILVKYVDDLFAVKSKDKINTFLNILNNITRISSSHVKLKKGVLCLIWI